MAKKAQTKPCIDIFYEKSNFLTKIKFFFFKKKDAGKTRKGILFMEYRSDWKINVFPNDFSPLPDIRDLPLPSLASFR